MDAKVSIKTKTKTFQNLNKNCPFVYKLLCNALSVLKWAGVKYFLKEHSYFFRASASSQDVCKYILIFLSMGDMKKKYYFRIDSNTLCI